MDSTSGKVGTQSDAFPNVQVSSFPTVTPMPVHSSNYGSPPTVPRGEVMKQRSNTYQDIKLILRDKPTTVFCHTCNRNVVSNLKGKWKSLLLVIALAISLLIGFFYLVDEFECDRSLIIIGFVTLIVVVVVTGVAAFRLSYHHVCPLCGRDLGNRGDIVSRQIQSVVAV